MKIDRLISLIMVLLEHDKVSATKLAEMFDVTPRTIYRDVETLSQAGIPITAYPGVNGGISIMRQYKVDNKLFSPDDIATLLIGLGSLSSTLLPNEIVSTLAKVKGLIPEKQRKDVDLKSSQIFIDLTRWAGNKNLSPNLEKIKSALNASQCLSFNYSDSTGKRTVRTIEPYQLVLKEGHWYIQGYCTKRQDFRIFKLYRISALEVLAQVFEPRPFNSKRLDDSCWIDSRLITIKLLIDNALSEQIAERCSEENITPYDEHRLLVELAFVEDEPGYQMLLSFGERCECLEPENIRQGLIQRIERMRKVYD